MSLTQAQITKFLISALVNPQVISPLSETVPVAVPATFTSISSLKVKTGTYTPNNDTLNIDSFATNGVSPNFVMLFVDGQANLTMATAGNPIATVMPVSKILVFTSPIFAADFISSLVLDGTTAAQNPMVQGQPVNYTVIYGQAVIT